VEGGQIKKRALILPLAILLSILAHVVLLNLKGEVRPKIKTASKPHQFKVDSIRTVGEKNKKDKSLVFVPKQINNNSEKTQAPKGKKINLSDLQAQAPSVVQAPTTKDRPDKKKKRPIDALSLNNESVKSFMQNTPNAGSSGEYARAFGKSNVLVELEVPQGVPEDELNKYELVFYSFRKRTAINYVNSFYNELTDFSTSNPHLRFPMTEEQESMTGRITYDRSGNVVRIRMLKWTNKDKLQDFFLHVLKNMNNLPNPPEVIINDVDFHVYYSLSVNGSSI
jgi:hypothetical protein